MRIHGLGARTRGHGLTSSISALVAARLGSVSASWECASLLAGANTSTAQRAACRTSLVGWSNQRGFHTPIASTISTREVDPSRPKRWQSTTSPSSDPTTRGAATSDEQQSSASPAGTQTPRAPKNAIDPSSAHHDLSTFLAHAARSGLSTSSTVYTGTAYEYLTLRTLSRYGFELHRVGGRGDRGVDLIGFWRIPKRKLDDGDIQPHAQDVLRVLVQCKRMVGKSAKLGPNIIRELDGAVRGARLGMLFEAISPRAASIDASETDSGQDSGLASDTPTTTSSQAASVPSPRGDTGPALGVLVGTRPATKGVVDSLRRSNRGLVWIMLEELAVPNPATHPALAAGDATREGTDRGQGPSTRVGPQDDGDGQLGNENASEIKFNTNLDTDLDHHQEDHMRVLPTTPSPLQGRVKQILWNQAARDLGLEGVDVIQRHTTTTSSVMGTAATEEDGEAHGEAVLAREGRVILG